MKYTFAYLALSCAAFSGSKAAPNQPELKTGVIEPKATIQDISGKTGLFSANGPVISVPNKSSSEGEDENSPALLEDDEEEEDDDEEEDEEDKEDATKSKESISGTVDIETIENAYSAAGLKYNKDSDLPVMSQKKVSEDNEIPPVPQVTACRTEGQIAITYSEGPSDTTARIARYFNNEKIPANFFVNTNWLKQQQYVTVLKNVYDAGHLIGMTYRLPTEEPESMSEEEIKQDIINNAKMIEDVIHVAPKYVRLHFSAQSDHRIEPLLNKMGYVLVSYNLDGKDYNHSDPKDIEKEYSDTFKRYQSANNDKKGSFIAIQYDIPETGSLSAAPNIIDLVKKEGYDAVRIDSCLNDAKPYKASATSLEYVNDKFSFGTLNYKKESKTTAIITNNTEDEGRVLVANNESINTSAGSMIYPSISYLFIPIIAYSIITAIF